jgi:tRNA(fMet)-specific endonuclease VapC
MIYVVDTNLCINILRNKDPLLARKFHAHAPADIVVCSIVLSELYYGAALSKQPPVESAKVQAFVQPYSRLPLDDESGRIYGELRAEFKIRGTPMGVYDLMIASIALANKLTVVTHNTADFSRVPGLTLEDWQTP